MLFISNGGVSMNSPSKESEPRERLPGFISGMVGVYRAPVVPYPRGEGAA